MSSLGMVGEVLEDGCRRVGRRRFGVRVGDWVRRRKRRMHGGSETGRKNHRRRMLMRMALL